MIKCEESDKRLIVEKMFYRQRSQLWFIENYYSDKLGFRIKIDIDHSYYTSYYDGRQKTIYVSTRNLVKMYDESPKLFYSLFYTLLLHEIGHAIYTGELKMSSTANVLEDNRIEYQISKWNTKVRFDLFRYVFQDKIINIDVLYVVPMNIGLALFRTVDNSKYVKFLSKTEKGKKLVEKALKLEKKYRNKDFRVEDNYEHIKELESIIEKVDGILFELHQMILIEKKKQHEKESITNEEQESNEEDFEENEYQDEDEDENEEEYIEDDEDVNEEDEDEDEDEDEEEEEEEEEDDYIERGNMNHEEYEDEFMEFERSGELIENDVDDGIGLLYNPNNDTEPYEKHNVSVFTTYRRTGIKGNGTVGRYTGNAKELQMRKYARRGFVTNEKLFNKQSKSGRGGKSASVVFYLDISSSMRFSNRLYNAINYLKSFYDSMHKHMEIRMFAFGAYTYKFGRNELNKSFIFSKTEGATSPKAIPLRPNEECIFITDGGFDTEIPKSFFEKSHFVVIDPSNYTMDYFQARNTKNLYIVSNMDIFDGFEKATEGIKKLLKGRN